MASTILRKAAVVRAALSLVLVLSIWGITAVPVMAGDLDGVGGLRFTVDDQGGGGIDNDGYRNDSPSLQAEILLPPQCMHGASFRGSKPLGLYDARMSSWWLNFMVRCHPLLMR